MLGAVRAFSDHAYRKTQSLGLNAVKVRDFHI